MDTEKELSNLKNDATELRSDLVKLDSKVSMTESEVANLMDHKFKSITAIKQLIQYLRKKYPADDAELKLIESALEHH